METQPISIMTLTAGQVEKIEIATGLPVDRWDESPSRVSLFVNILSIVTGKDAEEFRSMPITELIGMVDMSGDDPKA